MKIAIVTGASSGIGREYVKQISEREEVDEIWAVARRKERLEELKNSIKTPIIPICIDLKEKNSDEKIKEMLASKNPDVCVLVNAAGYGRFGTVEDTAISDNEGMVELNVNSLMKITQRVLPYMSDGAKIFMLGSRAGFHPIPYMNVYSATKAFVVSFSRALNVELKQRGIRVIAVSPGWVRTEFIDRASEGDGKLSYFNSFVTAEQVVTRSYRDISKGKDISVCGFSTRLQLLLAKLLPHKLVMYIWCKQQNKR